MLINTFCHIPGVGITTEKKLWAAGIHNWSIFQECGNGETKIPLSGKKVAAIKPFLEESFVHLTGGNPFFFGQHLPAGLHWRLFPDFRDSIAYVDIETTGLENWCNEITTIALYDGQTVHTYVNGMNLNDFVDDIQRFKIIVTYNGRCFDVPFIERYFRLKLDHVHIDLRFILKSLGFSGGLKACERQMGIDRGELSDIDGYYAVILWNDYKGTGNQKSLRTLIKYNSMDAKNLEAMLVMAYNMKLNELPFCDGVKIL